MSNNTRGPNGAQAVVFKTPTLGHAVCLGELYDQRSGTFLGVQLYPQDEIQETVTDIRHTQLSVSLSTTLEQKATLLDINASLALEVLGGLVKVSGSASYLNDTKSNTHEQAFALALKMRLNERRILFAEKKLGREVLEVAKEDYIANDLATHFVSAIVYGGNFIVNLVARQSELTKEERIEGKLQAEITALKGAISLEGSVEAKMKGQFKDMNNKFDLVMHGDVALERVPINPEDVLDTFPDAAALITAGGGVPISVTLQPIPKKLFDSRLVYQLDADLVDDVLKAFSLLDDLRSRFTVLQDTAKGLQSFIPGLAQAIRLVADNYSREHNKRLHELRQFLDDYQHGRMPRVDCVFVEKEEAKEEAKEEVKEEAEEEAEEEEEEEEEAKEGSKGNICGITGRTLLQETSVLYNYHLDPNRADKLPTPFSTVGLENGLSTHYPSSLVGLEDELSKFQNLASDIRRVGKSLEGPASSIYLSNIEDVSRGVRIQNKIPLFIMTPLTAKALNLNSEQLTPDLAIVRFLAMFRQYAAYFKDPSSPAYIMYAEDLNSLELRLPNDGMFSGLKGPAIFIGQVDIEGKLTWSAPPPAIDLSLKLHHKPSSQNRGDLSFDVDIVDVTQAFSFQIRAKAPNTSSGDGAVCIVQFAETKLPFLQFQTPLNVTLKRQDGTSALIDPPRSPTLQAGKLFTATIVQDIKGRQWILYLDKEPVATVLFRAYEVLQQAVKLQIAYPDDIKWWDGEVYEVKAFSYALTKEQIAAEIQSQEATTK